MKQIIVTRTGTQGGILTLQVVLWYPVPAGDEVPLAAYVSAYKEATQPEIDALRNGTVKEETDAFRLPKSLTVANIKGVLVSAWTDRKAFLDGNPPEGQHYGTFFDSVTGWSA